ALLCFRTSKPWLDRRFLGFPLFSYIQTMVGSTFSRLSFAFAYPNHGWIDVFSDFLCFRTSKPRLDRRFHGSPLFSHIQTMGGSTVSRLSFVFAYPNLDWIDGF